MTQRLPPPAPVPVPSIAVCVIAHDEVGVIENLIDDLASQTIFERADHEVTFYVLANGCSDGTAHAVRSHVQDTPVSTVIGSVVVHEIAEKGKPNAWNVLIHDVIHESVRFVVMIDADVRLLDRDLIERAVDGLAGNERADVATDRPVSDLESRVDLNLVERIVRVTTNTEHDPTTGITGHFYAARLTTLRRVHMPSGVIGEDGLLRALVLTDFFSSDDEDLRRIVHIPGVAHMYEAESTLRGIVRHQTRQTLGTITNIVLFDYIRGLESGVDLGEHFRRRNEAELHWLTALTADRWPTRTFRGARRRLLLRRLPPGSRSVRSLPPRLAATAFDLVIYLGVSRRLRNGSAAGFW